MHTILVADDSVTIQRAVEIVFDKEPFTVVKAGSGTEALARAKALQPHVVLVDHTMPDTNGYDLAAALKADPSTQAIPVLYFSATANPFDEARGKAAGVVGFVQKPFDCQTLLDRVRGILGVAATAPGSFVSSTPPTTASTSTLPRPPSLGGLAASLGGLPRPPSVGGVTRPGSAGPSGIAGAPNPIAVPQTPSRPATPGLAGGLGGAPAARELDPFGFGQAMSTPPQQASPSASPSASASASPSAAGSQSLPPARAPTPAPQPFSSPQAVNQAPASSGWQAMAPGAGLGGLDTPRAATPSWIPNGGTAAPTTTNVAPVAASTPPRPSARPNDDLMEISDFDVADVDSAQKATTKLDLSAVSRAAAAAEASLAPLPSLAVTAPSVLTATPTPAAPQAPTPAATPATLQPSGSSTGIGAAVDAVVARAAPQLAQSPAGAPSHQALSAEARTIVERIAWEVVPELAEVIIREEIQRLLKAKNG